MTSRERIIAALNRQPVDRTPRHEHFWPETREAWIEQGLSPDTDMNELARSDIRIVDGYIPTLRLEEQTLEETDSYRIVRDGNGAVKKYWNDHSGVPEFTGQFAVQSREDWDRYKDRLLKTEGRHDLAARVKSCREYHQGDYFVAWGVMGFWEASRDILGPETLLMNVALDPGWIREMMEHFESLFMRMYEELVAAGAYLDGLFFYEDLGYKNGLFISPASYREILWPSHCRIFQRLRDDGRHVIIHSCGRITQAVEPLIEAGIHCLQPLEAKAGMDLAAMKTGYGDQIAFMGNIDVMVLRTNDKDLVRREVLGKLKAGAAGGGYVFHSDHSIPPEVTLETYRYCQSLIDEFDLQASGG